MRWFFVCECGAKHNAKKDTKIIRHKDRETEFQHIEITEFDIECPCGRSREFRLIGGKWKEISFVQKPVRVVEVKPPPPPKEDTEPLCELSLHCGYCDEPFAYQARSTVNHICDRCGHGIHLVKLFNYKCEQCGHKFTREAGADAWCSRCQKPDYIAKLEGVEWEEPPDIDGALDIGGSFRHLLWSGPRFDNGVIEFHVSEGGLFKAYADADKSGRAALGFEFRQMAGDLLRFLVELADQFQDYDAVRWLAKYAVLGKRRVPDDHHMTIEKRLTRADRPRAAREWWDTQKWVESFRDHVTKKPFPMHMKQLSEELHLWRVGFVNWKQNVKDNPRLVLPPEMIEDELIMRKESWKALLQRLEIVKEAIPYPSNFDATGDGEALVVEVLIPLVRYWRKHEPEDYNAKKFPKDTSDAALTRSIREALGWKRPSNASSRKTRKSLGNG